MFGKPESKHLLILGDPASVVDPTVEEGDLRDSIVRRLLDRIGLLRRVK